MFYYRVIKKINKRVSAKLKKEKSLCFLMISKDRPKKVSIYITTYSKPRSNKRGIDMSKNYDCINNGSSKFICSICLSTSVKEDEKKYECSRRKSRSCPTCATAEVSASSCGITHKDDKAECKLDDMRTKNVQTSRTNVDPGLNLLNEVLTVFQSKKGYNSKDSKLAHSKTITLKDACVSAKLSTAQKPKLSFSKVFQLSIEEGGLQGTGKFSIINSCQPKIIFNSQDSIDLIKHKSSSIPQMKLEELKKSLKEKSNTNKDAIEEVNRMFATVKRVDISDDINRPLIRTGPRVLPVVKTSLLGKRCPAQPSEDISNRSNNQSCKCCQTNYYMSLEKQERFEKNVCCHKIQNRDLRSHNELICERCRKPGYFND